MNPEITIATQWLASEGTVCLAAVAKTWGSAPRKAGSLLIVKSDGTFEGSVSGGCVEGSVIAEAQKLLSEQTFPTFKELKFTVSSEQAWDVGLACGGEIIIWLFALGSEQLEPLQQAKTSLDAGEGGSLSIDISTQSVSWRGFSNATPAKVPEVDGEKFNLPLSAELRLEIVGAVHIAQHLAVIAEECGYKTNIIDPRGAFTDNRAFGTASVCEMWPDDYFKEHAPSPTTAVVTLTHDPKLDDAALLHVLASSAFYIGSLGSKKTHTARLERLIDAGLPEAHLKKIDAPIGLNIGANNPAEIAVAIMGKIIETHRKS